MLSVSLTQNVSLFQLEIGIPGPWGHGCECRNGRLGPLTVAATLTRPFLRTDYFQTHMNQTVEGKLLEVRELDRAATRVWRTAFRLGLFEPVSESPWSALGWEAIDSERNQGASLEAARQSLTLLKNDRELLPLMVRTVRLRLIGHWTHFL